MLHMLQWLYTYVSSVCSKYFVRSRRMLQMFYLDVAKVDVHVAIICFMCFQVFHTYVYKCFIWILHMFALVFK
jgi:hypothetical protein